MFLVFHGFTSFEQSWYIRYNIKAIICPSQFCKSNVGRCEQKGRNFANYPMRGDYWHKDIWLVEKIKLLVTHWFEFCSFSLRHHVCSLTLFLSVSFANRLKKNYTIGGLLFRGGTIMSTDSDPRTCVQDILLAITYFTSL